MTQRLDAPLDEHVIGIGGVFLRAKHQGHLADWYRNMLGIPINRHGGHDFFWRSADRPDRFCRTVLGLFHADTGYFPGPVMVNLIVRDLDGLLARLRDRGVEETRPREDYDYGRFAWISDPEGQWLELWEPVPGAAENCPPQVTRPST